MEMPDGQEPKSHELHDFAVKQNPAGSSTSSYRGETGEQRPDVLVRLGKTPVLKARVSLQTNGDLKDLTSPSGTSASCPFLDLPVPS